MSWKALGAVLGSFGAALAAVLWWSWGGLEVDLGCQGVWFQKGPGARKLSGRNLGAGMCFLRFSVPAGPDRPQTGPKNHPDRPQTGRIRKKTTFGPRTPVPGQLPAPNSCSRPVSGPKPRLHGPPTLTRSSQLLHGPPTSHLLVLVRNRESSSSSRCHRPPLSEREDAPAEAL